MSSPSPLIPQGSFQAKARGDSNVRLAVTTVIAIHVVFFGGLLLQGCQKDANPPAPKETNAPTSFSLPPMTNNDLYFTPPETQAVRTATAITQAPAPATNLYGDLPNLTRRIPASTVSSNTLGSLFPSDPAASPGREYEIARGDTFAKIARSNHITVAALTKANPTLDPARLKVGTRIRIPEAAAKPVGAAEAVAADGGAYVVKAGDTLTRIARQHGTTVTALRSLNALKTSQVRIGQKLKVPARAETATGATPVPVQP